MVNKKIDLLFFWQHIEYRRIIMQQSDIDKILSYKDSNLSSKEIAVVWKRYWFF